MAIIGNGAVRNGKIHPSRIRLLSDAASVSSGPNAPPAHPADSLRSKLTKRVRVLAHRQRTSESSIVDCALWYFFSSGQAANVMTLMGQAGIVPRRRRG